MLEVVDNDCNYLQQYTHGRDVVQISGDDYVFEARGISKRFGGVAALDGVDLELKRAALE